VAGIAAKDNGIGCGSGVRQMVLIFTLSNGAEVEDRRLVEIAAQVGFEAILPDAALVANLGNPEGY
jgi:hypothetical protein